MSWDICIEMNWNASWYGDCVSLVVSSCYGGTDAPFHKGWCFDFESGNQLTVTQMLQRMGADPAALEEALYRDVKRRDELDRQAAIERGLLPPGSLKEGNTAWWTSLDELPFSLDGKRETFPFVVRRFSALRGGVRDRCPDHPAGCTAAATGLGVAGAGRVDGSHGGDAG